MATAPVLETTRLRLDPFSEKYLTERYVGWLNDADVVRFSELRHSRHDAESCRAYLKSFESSPDYFWAVTSKEGQLGHIGNITVNIDSPNQVADIGILLGEKHAWGRGYGSEAWKAVCQFLLTLPSVRKVTAGAMASNMAMVRTALSAGMDEEARRPSHFLLEGKPETVVYWAIRCPSEHTGHHEKLQAGRNNGSAM